MGCDHGGGTVYFHGNDDTVDAIRGVDMQGGTFIRTSGGNVRVLAITKAIFFCRRSMRALAM